MAIPPSLLAASAVLALLIPTTASACACGCGIFDVGDGTVTPVASDTGLSVWFRYGYMDQDQNFEHGSDAPASDNSDKRLETSFFIAGGEYMINRKWTVMAELPLFKRDFTTTVADANGNNLIETAPLTDLGDAVMQVMYTGFSPDMTTGLGVGVKLPTGRYTSPLDRFGNQPYDRDSVPGTGSTDLQVSGYHVGTVAARLNWFGQAQYRFAVATRDGYRPGNELDGAIGLSYDLADGGGPSTGGGIGVAPALQLLGSVRAHDTGPQADYLNSGYRRLLIAPGVKLQLSRKLSVYGDVELPIAQYVNSARSVAREGTSGQLVAPALFKVQVNYGF
jgi:hypothetical protein